MQRRIKRARSIADIFELVQEAVRSTLRTQHAGLLVGLSDLGAMEDGFVGAFYSPDANTIVINRRPLQRIMQTRPDIYNAYLFHIMLHEYIHALGCHDEDEARALVEQVSRDSFGSSHIVTQLATNMQEFIPDIAQPSPEFVPPDDANIDFILGIDRKNTNYIN
jgi:hypothetical protein